MAAIGSTWASGTWASVGGWAAGTWADASALPPITRLHPDTQTALYIALQSLPAGPGGVNERLQAYLNTQYGYVGKDLQTLYARWLRDITG
jgi:hypothetical protein